MPFTFSKPPKRTRPRRDVYMVCEKCSAIDMVNKYTAGKVCNSCKGYTGVGPNNTFATEEELCAALEAAEADLPNE